MKSAIKFLNSLLVIAMLAVGIHQVEPTIAVKDAFSGLFVIATVYTVAIHYLEGKGATRIKSAMFAVVLLELWEKELINSLRFESREWMKKIRSYDKWVGNNVIHLHEIGADPDVLIDNNTYPIASAQRTDDEIPISLHKYDTTNTIITDDELYAIPYDKEGSAVRQHRETLEEQMANHGLHKMAASADGAETPVIVTTGADDGTGRLRFTPNDFVTFKDRCDKLDIPMDDRNITLCQAHINDMLLEDQSFRDRYFNTETGKLRAMLYGFKIYDDNYNPVYDAVGSTKKAFGAAGAADDRNGSTFFYGPRMARAKGTVKAYKSIAAEDPDNRQTKLGYRVYGVVINKTVLGTGAVIDGRV
jgi:hypothetical protein